MISKVSPQKLIKERNQSESVFRAANRIKGYNMSVIDLTSKRTTVPSPKQTKGRVFKVSRMLQEVAFLEDMNDDEQLKMLADILRENRQVQKIEINCQKNFISAKGIDYLSASIRSLHGLKSINLKFGESPIFDESLCKLAKALKMQPSLQEVNLDFLHCPYVTARGRHCIDQALRALPSIKNLHLNFKDTPRDTPYEGSKNLVRAFKVLTSLQNIQVTFDSQSQLTDALLSEITSALSPLHSLRCIDFVFDGCENLGMKTLGLALKPLTHLQALSLQFFNCGISGEELLHLLSSICTLTSLQRLRLKDSSSPVQSIAELSQFFSGLTSLKELDLAIGNLDVWPENLAPLAIELAKIPCLESLRLNFPGLSSGMDDFTKVLQTMKTLKSIFLFLQGCPRIVPDGILQNLTSMTWLESFSFQFHFNMDVDDATLEILSQGLKNLHALKTIHFKFTHCYSITDEGLSKLASSLKEMNCVNAVCLDFLSCNEITNKGMLDIFQALESKLTLKNLSVSFADCKEIDDEGVYGACKVIKTLISLETIFLNLEWCDNITNNGFAAFFQAVSILPYAEIQYFEDCENLKHPEQI